MRIEGRATIGRPERPTMCGFDVNIRINTLWSVSGVVALFAALEFACEQHNAAEIAIQSAPTHVRY
jgi:hypothetical protein